MKKILIIASIGNFLKFEVNDIQILLDLGYQVDCAANFDIYNGIVDGLRVKKIHIPFERKPFRKQNIKAYKELKKVLDEGLYDAVHCHTPIGGFITRLAAKKMQKKKKLKVIYTAHGFHFYNGAPLKNWIIFYPIEKWLSFYTDILITINNEDYERANCKFQAKSVHRIPGVGLNVDNFAIANFDKETYRKTLGLRISDFVILSVGELNINKNQKVIIRAIARLQNKAIHYVIAGEGSYKKNLKQLADDLNVSDQIHFLGYRDDIKQLNHVADLFAFPSYREGLGIASLEAMACGLPLLTSNRHGINDYSIDGVSGFAYDPDDVTGFQEGIKFFFDNPEKKKEIGLNNQINVKKYSLTNVEEIMREIYKF